MEKFIDYHQTKTTYRNIHAHKTKQKNKQTKWRHRATKKQNKKNK